MADGEAWSFGLIEDRMIVCWTVIFMAYLDKTFYAYEDLVMLFMIIEHS